MTTYGPHSSPTCAQMLKACGAVVGQDGVFVSTASTCAPSAAGHTACAHPPTDVIPSARTNRSYRFELTLDRYAAPRGPQTTAHRPPCRPLPLALHPPAS